MHSILSFTKDALANIFDVISENDISSLKKSDEFAYRQFKESIILKNSRRCTVFSLFEFIFGIIFLIFSVFRGSPDEKGSFISIIGSAILIVSAIMAFVFYKYELCGRRYDYKRLNGAFYIFWNLFSAGCFFISAGCYFGTRDVSLFFIFAAVIVTVPVFRLNENIIAAIICLIPCVYYGISEKLGALFYISITVSALFFIWINCFKINYYTKRWIYKRRLREASERCSNMSQTDNLTGMLNRTGLSVKFRERYQNSEEVHKIAVIMADIDNFRFYNHKYGYDRSDRCLYDICNCIRIISKPVTDIAARFGGDDFILVVEDMDELEVMKFAEQLRQSVETMAIPFGENGVVTISIGISGISEFENEDTYSKLLNEADLQLMIAKNSGKNCIGYRNRPFIHESRRKQ